MKNKILLTILISLLLPNKTLNLDAIYTKLNIDKQSLPSAIVPEQQNLVSVGPNIVGKEIFLSKNCANAWNQMHEAAKKDSIKMTILSGFRSYYRQYAIINYKLSKGLKLDAILKENKLPGLSQHHSGNAIDIASNSYKLSLDFQDSSAYEWLVKNAHKYGFYLSYPKDNKEGIMFEPWHWYFKE